MAKPGESGSFSRKGRKRPFPSGLAGGTGWELDRVCGRAAGRDRAGVEAGAWRGVWPGRPWGEVPSFLVLRLEWQVPKCPTPQPGPSVPWALSGASLMTSLRRCFAEVLSSEIHPSVRTVSTEEVSKGQISDLRVQTKSSGT